jgi:hypothetical protein
MTTGTTTAAILVDVFELLAAIDLFDGLLVVGIDTVIEERLIVGFK